MTIFPSGSSIMFPYERFSDVTLYQFGHQYCQSGYAFGMFSWKHFLFH